MTNNIHLKFFLNIYTFLFIFNPGNFFRFNLLYVLGLFSLGYFIINKNQLFLYLSNKRILVFIAVCFLFFIYLSVLYLFGANDALLRGYSFILIVISLLCSLTILSIYGRVYCCRFDDFCKFIVGIGGIQLIFVILALTVPSFREWTLMTARQSSIQDISNDFGSGLRSFGLATGYTSTFPMLMGLFALLSIYFFIFSNKISEKTMYFFFFLGMVLSVILNARIGLIPIVFFVIISPLYLVYKRKFKLLISLVFIIGLSFVTIGLKFLKSDYFFRLMQGVDELKDLFDGRPTGTFESLSYMWFFPENNINFLWGEGKLIVGAYPIGSDIGLVQDIFMFGAIPTFFLGLSLLYLITPLLRRFVGNFGFLFLLIFIFSMCLYYLKGMNFYSNEICNFILLLTVFCLFNCRKMGLRYV